MGKLQSVLDFLDSYISVDLIKIDHKNVKFICVSK